MKLGIVRVWLRYQLQPRDDAMVDAELLLFLSCLCLVQQHRRDYSRALHRQRSPFSSPSTPQIAHRASCPQVSPRTAMVEPITFLIGLMGPCR